ncbi:class I SAM-dependent methyltransferase [Mesoterricola sediminis]|uniref:DOT1 domain-containing protein n=1 Tax=Mesoterricola sediminis TaxID=2927980 RepID=A0AA48KCG5_9BACT|nr:hypothetical protein [Mesoterricola sediminis]BDU77046.1 hypothetical protein METESE_20040 [Mesoterricola sediminis]
MRQRPARLMIVAALVLGLGSACRVPAPAPAPLSWRVAAAHLEDVFADIPGSSIDDFRAGVPEAERHLINASHGAEGISLDKAHIYGEPSPAATDAILRRLGAGRGDVLFDLGCGRGFFLMQALLTTPLPKVVGVELAGSRAAVARAARDRLRAGGLLGPGRVLELREEDLARTDLTGCTLVFMDSVFFSDELLTTVARRLHEAGTVRGLAMIQKGLPPNPWFELAGTERLKMSWSPRFGTDVLFYRPVRGR